MRTYGWTLKLLKFMLIILHWTFVKELSKLAIEALINLSQEPQLAEKIVRAEGIGKAMEFIGKLCTNLNRLLVMLIVNLTQSESGASRLLQVCKVDCIETTFRELSSILVSIFTFTISARTRRLNNWKAYMYANLWDFFPSRQRKVCAISQWFSIYARCILCFLNS